MEEFARLSIEQVCCDVGLLDLSQGLTDQDVIQRRDKDGLNKLPNSQIGLSGRLKDIAYENRQIIGFIAAMTLLLYTLRNDSSASLWSHLFFVIFSVIPALYRYYASVSEQFDKAVDDIGRTIVAIRNGYPCAVRQEHLVVGDVVILKAGDSVPADIRIVEANNLQADESFISGYAEAKEKSSQQSPDATLGEAECGLFMGTKITSGTCKGVVVATGKRTVQWQLSQIASDYGLNFEALNPLQSGLVSLSLWQIIFAIMVRMASGSDEAMKYLLVSAIILLKIVDNVGIARPLVDKILTERLLDYKVISRSLEKTEFIKDIDCLYLRATDLVRSDLEATKVFVDGEIWRVSARQASEAPISESLVTLCRQTNLATSGLIESAKEGSSANVIGNQLEGAVLKYTNKVESLLVSRSQTNVVCFSGSIRDGCQTFLRRTNEGFTLSVFGPLAQLCKRCDRMLHRGRYVPFNPQLVKQAAGEADAYAVVFAKYDFDRFSMEALEVEYEDLPQTNLIMAGFFVVEVQSNATDFKELRALCQDYQVKLLFHSELDAKQTILALDKIGVVEGIVSSELAMSQDKAFGVCSTAIVDEEWLRSALVSGDIAKVKRVLTKPIVAFTDMRQGGHATVIRLLQELGFSVAVLCTLETDLEDFKRADFSASFAAASHNSCKLSSDFTLLDDDLSKLLHTKAMAEAQERSYISTQMSICYFYMPVLVSILLASMFGYPLSTMLLFCIEMGSVMIPVFSLGSSHPLRMFTFSALQTWVIVTLGGVYCFAFALADYGYFDGQCVYNEACLKGDAFEYAQSAFFLGIVLGQWATSVLLSVDEAMTGTSHVHWGSVHMGSIVKLFMALLLCFIPQLSQSLHTKPIRLAHSGLPAIYLVMVVFLLESLRSRVLKRG